MSPIASYETDFPVSHSVPDVRHVPLKGVPPAVSGSHPPSVSEWSYFGCGDSVSGLCNGVCIPKHNSLSLSLSVCLDLSLSLSTSLGMPLSLPLSTSLCMPLSPSVYLTLSASLSLSLSPTSGQRYRPIKPLIEKLQNSLFISMNIIVFQSYSQQHLSFSQCQKRWIAYGD